MKDDTRWGGAESKDQEFPDAEANEAARFDVASKNVTTNDCDI